MASKVGAVISKPALIFCGQGFVSTDVITEVTFFKMPFLVTILIHVGKVHFIGSAGASFHALLQNSNYNPGT